ncbi:MAG: hypothetical protein NTY07_10020 [Bacteroidia bacterium]|nr:hypothetical protein [Bacteroidia bacterium]
MLEQFEKSIKALKVIEKIDLMSTNSYQAIVKIIEEQVIIPYVTQVIPVGQELYRARLNERCSFNLKTDISYNNNIDLIKIGRANYYQQPIFYASHKKETAIFETSHAIKNREKGTNEIITVGKWIVNKPIVVIPIFQDKEFFQKNETIKEKYLKYLETNPLFTSKWTQIHLELISKHFARKVNCIEEYKISCAFFNVMKESFKKKGISGIMFPTVEWEKNDLNVALTPECVDNHLSLNQVDEFKINMDDNPSGIIQIGTSDCIAYKINDIILKI